MLLCCFFRSGCAPGSGFAPFRRSVQLTVVYISWSNLLPARILKAKPEPWAQPKGRGPLLARRRLTTGGTVEVDRPRHFGCAFAALCTRRLGGELTFTGHTTAEPPSTPRLRREKTFFRQTRLRSDTTQLLKVKLKPQSIVSFVILA